MAKMKARSIFLMLVCSLIFPNISGWANDAFFTTVGDIGQIALPATAFLMTLKEKDRQGSRQFIKVYVVTGAVTFGLNHAIDAKRPNGDHHSFPSGHTSSAFSAAAFIQKRYGWQCGLPAYIYATAVGISRIEAKKHWFHDVAAGAAIGILVSELFVTPRPGVEIRPVVSRDFNGLTANVRW
jgi:membrane-associated phospholipid phosphatase